jgi:hypothetical protein
MVEAIVEPRWGVLEINLISTRWSFRAVTTSVRALGESGATKDHFASDHFASDHFASNRGRASPDGAEVCQGGQPPWQASRIDV